MEIAAKLGRDRIGGLVIDTEAGPIRLGLARKIAEIWGAEYRFLDELEGPRMSEGIRRSLFALGA